MRRARSRPESGTPPRLPLDEAHELWGLHLWGDGLFGIDDAGALTLRPTGPAGPAVAVGPVVEQAIAAGLTTPLVLRFPQLLAWRIDALCGAFDAALAEFGVAGGTYRPVYPLKVNQRRPVVEALVEAGRPRSLSVEVGSRAELHAALALDLAPDAMVVVNGYKDRATLELAILGARAGRRVVVVLEKLFELDALLAAYEQADPGPLPEIGLRARLYARGAGKWWKSTGVTAKFGLTTTALLSAVDRLDRAGRLDLVRMLHFHIGSQVPEIRRFKTAFREAARMYARLRARGVPLEILNLGGGLAVDYDGSRTASDASMNYSLQEYANDAVFLVDEVCREENVPFPMLVSESGRALTAHHALLITDVIGTIEADPPAEDEPVSPDAPRVLREMAHLAANITAKNYREYFHDAVLLRDEMITLFNVGLVGLADRARVQGHFWRVCRAALRFARRERVPSEEFEQLERALDEKFVCNFSVFQSVPDHWALGQLFPIVPVERLREPPRRSATLVDITCDSDGEIARFVDPQLVRDHLALHAPADDRGRPYRLAVALVGAYQDVMGDMHNLFGTPAEADVIVEGGVPRIREARPGDSAARALELSGWDPAELTKRLAAALDARVGSGALPAGERDAMLDRWRRSLARSTYLLP
ncbi:MAG: biosynthetic arginine decarboxylase [Acidobacteria bacterium]|nr:MAG: biosynthetic arginine decarboxylase [Acidobacteriota bacterium]